MASFIQQYKTYARRRRQLLSEESFKYGMRYTNNPLGDGFNKTIVNYSIDEDGQVLRPRKGLRAEELSLEVGDAKYSQNYSNIDITLTQRREIYHSAEIDEEDGHTYRQVIVGGIDGGMTANNEVVTGTVDLVTVYPEDKSVAKDKPVGLVAIPNVTGLKTLEQHTVFNNTMQYKFFYNAPLKAEIHGIQLQDPYNIATHIGTSMAAEGGKKFYCFRKTTGDTGKGKLVFATLKDTEMDLNGTLKTEKAYQFEELTPKATTALDAPLNMYNMLENDPYNFTDKYLAGTLQFLGVFPTGTDGIQKQTTYMNTTYRFRMNYVVNQTGKYKIKWEWKEPNSSLWNLIEEKTHTFSEATPKQLYVDWSSPVAGVIFRVTATPDGTTEPSQVLLATFGFSKEGETNNNLDYINYDLSTCIGMTTWKQRLVVYGPEKGRNLIFVSEPNNPGWFPFPKNVDLFDEPIVKCVPYLDKLIVVTTCAIYILTLTGDSWTKQTLQSDLNINKWEAHLIQVIKNMMFFKSNNYYYMVVPSAKTASGLAVAPISKTIEMFLDKFEDNVQELLKDIYDIKEAYELVNYYNYVDYSKIHNVYVYRTETSKFINLNLTYDINGKYWCFEIFESKTFVRPYKKDITDVNILVSMATMFIPYTQSEELKTRVSYGFQFLKYSQDLHKDFYILPSLSTSDNPQDGYDFVSRYKNYQFIDTGYREQESDFKKRYRELEIKFNNYSQLNLTFYTQFILDGYLRRDDARYTINQVVNPADHKYGVITYDRTYSEENGTVLPGSTILGNNEDDTLAWKLDVSQFPETIFWQAQIPISGKGFVPRLKLLNMDEEDFELLNITWVFRTLYAR